MAMANLMAQPCLQTLIKKTSGLNVCNDGIFIFFKTLQHYEFSCMHAYTQFNLAFSYCITLCLYFTHTFQCFLNTSS